MNPIFWLIIGLGLIFAEFYLPGAILGIVGGLFVLISVVTFAYDVNSPLYLILYLLATGAAVALTIKFSLSSVRYNKSRFQIYSDDAQNGYTASKYDHSAIGKTGIVLTDLKPGGYIMIEGKQHQALSRSGYIVKGSEVDVIGGQEESLLVKQSKKVST
jgi:membrane-bound serine protease (ClpP class)